MLDATPARKVLLNDTQSELNPTFVRRVVTPTSLRELREIVRKARSERQIISVTGSRHAMGAQQFAADGISINTRRLNRILGMDSKHGVVEVEAGLEWPGLIRYLQEAGRAQLQQWSIIQKQTTGDRFTIGGSLSANVHGSGVRLKPIVADVESFVLVNAQGAAKTCSRKENSELFSLAAGGYGLFGAIYSVKLRLRPRIKLEFVAETMNLEGVMPAFERAALEGCLHAHFQVNTDEKSADFLRKGMFCRWKPADPNTPLPEPKKRRGITNDDRREILLLAHTDKRRSFERLFSLLQKSSGPCWSDTHLLKPYFVGYHRWIDEKMNSPHASSETTNAVLISRDKLIPCMNRMREDFLKNKVDLMTMVIRVTEKDDDSFLSWAKEPCVGISYNQHTVHTPAGIEKSRQDTRRIIDIGIAHGGTFYLTFLRWPTRRQITACYPEFSEFLRLKLLYDPQELFQSEWYRDYK